MSLIRRAGRRASDATYDRATVPTIRIKKGVRPYGGRRVILVGRHTYPNGREVVVVRLPWDHIQGALREYAPDEVENEKRGF